MGHTIATFKRLHPAYKAVIGLVAPIATVVGMLLSLNVIQPFGEDALAAGVNATADAGTSAIAVSVASQGTSFHAEGEFDHRAGRGRLHYDFSATPGSERLTDVEVIFIRRQVYVKLGAGARPWIHADLATAHEEIADYAQAAGLEEPPPQLASLGELDFNDPSQVLAHLRRATTVEELGKEAIFGVPTRRYRAVIEPREPGAPRLTASAWIDGSDLIRRLDVTGDRRRAFRLRMDFSQFGQPVDVQPPAPAAVRELEEVLDRLLA